MTEPLTAEGYEQTKEKLADLERRLGEIEQRTDLDPEHLASVRRSCKTLDRCGWTRRAGIAGVTV
jgi:hypothetical protein